MENPDMNPKRDVYVVDDDHAVRKALILLLHSVSLKGQALATANEFLEAYDPRRPACMILDVRLHGMNGLALQSELNRRGIDVPVIIISGHADVPMAVEAVKNGALDFLEKPFRDQDLLDRVFEALELDEKRRVVRQERELVTERLSERERVVLDGVLDGIPNKGIAFKLGISTKAVESRRIKLMAKMEAESVADLVRMTLKADAG